eukprot:jgi/Chlat1/3425/Chrsp23S03752
MEDEDLLLSEVHANTRPTPTPTPTPTTTNSHTTTVFVASALDSDGDLVLPRKGHNKITQQDNNGGEARATNVVIRHSMATRLRAVGLQVWTGALLLAEWVLSNELVCCGVRAVELGAGPGDKGDDYAWSEGDIAELRDATLVLAADTIYDDNATDAFFGTLKWLLGFGKQKALAHHQVLIIALEKRVNFSADDLDIKAPAYNHFRSHFLDMGTCDDSNNTHDISKLFVGRRIGMDTIPQRFDYQRSGYLEVWELGLSDSENLECNIACDTALSTLDVQV